jgi:hypothetical protein
MKKKIEMTVVKCKRCGEEVLYYPGRDLFGVYRFWSLDKKEVHITACYLKLPRTRASIDRSLKRGLAAVNEEYEAVDEERTLDNANLIAEEAREPYKKEK